MKATCGGKGFIFQLTVSLRVQPVILEKSNQQELQRNTYMTSQSEEQHNMIHAGIQVLGQLLILYWSSKWNEAVSFSVGLPTLINQLRKSVISVPTGQLSALISQSSIEEELWNVFSIPIQERSADSFRLPMGKDKTL